jgi:mannosyltransferase
LSGATLQPVRWLPLLALVVFAAALRFFRIDAQSLWYDEGVSAFQLTRSYPEILRAAALDSHPPLYYWALKAWATAIPVANSEVVLRSLSAVSGVAAVVLTYLIGRRLFGTLVGCLAALLLAAAPLAVYYSQEVRMYALVTALGLLAAWAYDRRTYWLYAVAAAAGLYTQYLAIAFIVALNVHALLWLRDRTTWIKWLAANAVAALAFLPWLSNFLDQQSRGLNTSPRTAEGLALSTLMAYGGGLATRDVLLYGGAALAMLALLGLGLGTDWRAKTLVLLLWLIPLGLVIALGLRSGLFELRYLVVSLPGLTLLAALGIARLVRHPVPAVAIGMFALVPAAMGLSQQYFDPGLQRDDYRGLVQAIQREARPSDAVVLTAPNQVEVFSYYYRGELPAFPLPAQRPIDAEDTRQRLESIRGAHERVWLVSWAMNEADPRGVISAWMAENGFKASHDWYGSVQLSLVAFGNSAAPIERLELPLDNGIVLEGYRLGTRSLKAGDTLPLTLVWRAERGPTTERWKVFTHLLDARPTVVAQRDAEPADNLRPTTTWQSGERIEDNYGIVVPEDLAAGAYTLEIGMYVGEQRAQFEGRGDHLVLGQVQVAP